MDESSSKNDDGEAVTQQITTVHGGKIAAEQRLPEGKGRVMDLGFDCGLLTIKCMDQEVPRYHAYFMQFG